MDLGEEPEGGGDGSKVLDTQNMGKNLQGSRKWIIIRDALIRFLKMAFLLIYKVGFFFFRKLKSQHFSCHRFYVLIGSRCWSKNCCCPRGRREGEGGLQADDE